MAKKVTIDQEITSLDQPWGGTYQNGQEWGLKKERVEEFLKAKLSAHETSIAGKVAGVIVNNTEVTKDANGKVNIIVPTVTTDVTNPSNANAAQAGAVASEINAINSNLIADIQLGETSQDGSMVELNFFNAAGDKLDDLTVMIPAAQEVGEIIQPVITTELLTASRIKLGDSISLRWGYDCLRKFEGVSERVNYPAQTIAVTVKIGTTTVYTENYAQVAVGTTNTLTLSSDIINQAGTVSISVVATTPIDEEVKTSRGSKSVTVITMDLATTFDPASQLALSNGYTDGQTIAIPYTYTVPTGTTLRVWVDGVLDATDSISGTGRNYVYLTVSNLSAGRHNVQLIAESAGLLSNAVSVDVLKAGGTADYLGIRMKTDVSQLSSMPLPYAYGATALPLSVSQFEELELDVAAWNNDTLTSTIVISVDGVTTQTLTADRSLQSVSQRFDTAGSHTMVIQNGETALRTFSVVVAAAAGVTERETVGYRTKLTATGRSNGEENPADWGGITTFTGVDWRTNGWNRGSDGVDALLLTNGAKSVWDIQPFVQDVTDGDYSIETRGMTLEMELMVSQVMERGATIVSCLYDNGGQGYPMGIKVTTEEAGLFFGGVEEITTAEDLVDENGNYIDYEGNIVDEEHKVPLKITRPHGVSRNIARDMWIRIAFVVQPVINGYGLAMLFINGKLSRANRYSGSLRQAVPQSITIDSDKATVRVRNMRYYRFALTSDESLDNWIIDRPTAALIQSAHTINAVGDTNNTTDSDGNIAISREALLGKRRGVLTIIRSGDAGTGLDDLFTGPYSNDKKHNFKADLVRWEPPLDDNGNPIGEGFEARNVRIRIQGTSSVKYPYKNIRIYLMTAQDGTLMLIIGGVDVTGTAAGYALRGSGNSIAQDVLCAKTDFVDSSMAGNTGGAQLFDETMKALGREDSDYLTPPQQYDLRVRQAIDGIPCDIFTGTSENGTLTYCGQFVLNNEKSKSAKIFGMDGVKDSNGSDVDFRRYENGVAVIDTKPFALEALTNSSPMTLFQSAGSANSTALANQLAAEFDNGFEFNHPEDAKWATIGTGSYADWGGAQTAIKRLFGWIYDCVADSAGVRAGTMTTANPDYGDQNGWSGKSKWVSMKFKQEFSQYFKKKHLLSYYLIINYLAGKDQLAKNILWRVWDGLIWYATFYDGDTWEAIRNDAFIVYLYDITRDSYDSERAKYAFEGHNSWLWCLVLANFEEELRECAQTLRSQLTTEKMRQKFIDEMIGNWSARQYNKSGKLKYIDTIDTKNYVYTLTGSREEHITQFLTDRARLLDASYDAGGYNGDVITFTVVRRSSDTPSSLNLKSGDLYYFGYKLNGIWLQGPSRAAAGESLTLNFTATLATNDPLMLGGASCIKELDLTNMGSQLNGTVGLSLCTMLSKLIMPATNGVANAPLTFGDTAKLEYVDITGQTSIHTGTAGLFDISKHTRLTTFLAGGTSLTNIKLPEGAPIQTLVMPATLQTLTLRYLPKLNHSGLTLQGTTNITALNFAECPNLSWQTLLQQCQNIDHIRIEGMSGGVRSAMLRPFMSGYRGLTASGTEQTFPALIGKVHLIDVVDDFDTMKTFFAQCGLELEESQYSEYIFDDEETDPCNITNEDNQTGYAYYSGAEDSVQHTVSGGVVSLPTGHPLGYEHSGHVDLIHDRCVPVVGQINLTTHKMNVTKLPTGSWGPTGIVALDGGGTINLNDPNGEGYDIFLYVPKYFYKGVNDYKNARKHLFLSGLLREPLSTATETHRYALSDLIYLEGKVVDKRYMSVGDTFSNASLSQASELTMFRVDVTGMKQVRFPGHQHSNFCSAFVDENGNVLSLHNFQMENVVVNNNVVNPSDFDNSIGDYIFLPIPDGAMYLYFQCSTSLISMFAQGKAQGAMPITDGNGDVTGYAAVLLTDSSETEAIEPDWVEHKPELIGIYSGSCHVQNTNGDRVYVSTIGKAVSGLRSISGVRAQRGSGTSVTSPDWSYDSNGNPIGNLPSTYTVNGTAQDFFNLARIRTVLDGVVGGKYTTVPYETSKDMANLFMAWFGTRDIESIVGVGSSSDHTTGIRNQIGGLGDSNNAGCNKMWGIEAWTGTVYEWMDNGCLNAPSFARFLKDRRPDGSVIGFPSDYAVDYYYNILQQDGKERRVKAATTGQATCVARVRFGRYCDIVVSSYTAETTYAMGYAAYQSTNGSKGRVLGRSSSSASANAGVAYSITNLASSLSFTYYGGRLCFFGEIENEEILL